MDKDAIEVSDSIEIIYIYMNKLLFRPYYCFILLIKTFYCSFSTGKLTITSMMMNLLKLYQKFAYLI